jgi:CRP-like cAMP-binding protein
MHTVADRVDYIELLEGIPALSMCTADVLDKFLTHSALRAHCAAGEVVCGLHEDRNLYVLTSGKATLHVGDDVEISLEPGDYFGQDSAHHHKLAGTVVASTDVEVLVIGPQDLAQLEVASSRDRHPSLIGWRLERSTVIQRRRRTRRRAVLTVHSL